MLSSRFSERLVTKIKQTLILSTLFCFGLLLCNAAQAKEHKHKHHWLHRSHKTQSTESMRTPKIPVTGTTILSPFDIRFANFIERWRIPGASVAIMRNGQMILNHGYGYADLEKREPVQPNSIFRLGSVSKTIASVTLLKLVQDGKLGIDDKAFDVLNDLQPIRTYNPQIKQITIRNLLQMSSGWQTNVIDPMFGPWTAPMLQSLTGEVPPNCETAVRMMMGMRLQFRPGTQFSYSNLNYCMLGLLTNKVTGTPYGYQSYENYVQQHLLMPFGITTMRIGDTLPQNRVPGEVKYYVYPGFNAVSEDIAGGLARTDGLPYSDSQILKKNYADGGWIASAPDLAKFLQALSSHKILSPEMMRVMLEKPAYSKQSDNYFAMGWNVRRINGHVYYMKTGSFTGTYAFIMQGDDGTSYATLFNIKPPQRIQFQAQLRRVLFTAP